jgi:hypothetical protein
MIRQQINRLSETAERLAETQPALAAIQPLVAASAERMNEVWQTYQTSVLSADKERDERDQAVTDLLSWHKQWRPVVLMLVPGAKDTLRVQPRRGGTPDEVIGVCEDLARFINDNPATASFREAAAGQLDDGIDRARRKTATVITALATEAAARQAHGDACKEVNTVLVYGSAVVRTFFGPTSPEYRQLLSCASAREGDEIEAESQTEEGDEASASPA